MDEDRDVFAKHLERDRKLRRLALTLIPDLLSLPHAEGMAAVDKARKLVRLMEGGAGPVKPVPAQAAALYSRLPLNNSRDALRILHIIETTLRYVEDGVVDARNTSDIIILLGAQTTDAKHLRLGASIPANDCELMILPDFPQAAATD